MTAKVTKKYCFNDINKNIKSIKWLINKKLLENIRKAYFDLKKIHKARII